MDENPNVHVQGIVAAQGDGFKLCGVLIQQGGANGSRPKAFKSTKDDQAILIVLKPRKP
jgi:hypothetical protein